MSTSRATRGPFFAYLLRPAAPDYPKTGGVLVVYSRCAIPNHCRAEVLRLANELVEKEPAHEKPIYGCFHIDATFTEAEFLKGYVGDTAKAAEHERLIAQISAEGWEYEAVPASTHGMIQKMYDLKPDRLSPHRSKFSRAYPGRP